MNISNHSVFSLFCLLSIFYSQDIISLFSTCCRRTSTVTKAFITECSTLLVGQNRKHCWFSIRAIPNSGETDDQRKHITDDK